jgi:hypothetical protein
VLYLYAAHVCCEFQPEIKSIRILFASTIFLGAFLLFTVEPLAARRILPWFGGSAAVWSTCLVFYQVALLAGYLYARMLEHNLRPRVQAFVHISALAVSLFVTPIGPGSRWEPFHSTDSAWLIFRMLTATVGLPFLVLAATGPLLQAWLARVRSDSPYGMFAVSNFASLLALLAYPAIIEPFFGTTAQRIGWSWIYFVFVLLCSTATWGMRNAPARQASAGIARLPMRQVLEWLALSGCGSMLLLSVTNHINQNVAAVPLLWILPLATYLLSFVLTFGVFRIYSRSLWMRLLAVALGVLGYAIYNIDSVIPLQVSVPILLGGLFVCCVYCHGELNRLRPPTGQLTTFYLTIAAGGAAGAIFVGLIAPLLFSGIYELPVTLVFTALLALVFACRERLWALTALWSAVTACMVAVVVMNVLAFRENALSLRRGFYGSLRTVQTPHAGPDQQRILFHGTIEHGSQFLAPARQMRATTYYGPDSGVGILLRECFSSPKRVGIVGLGAGTLAAYGRKGDHFRFYEINSQIADMAQSLFFYLRESPAQTAIVLGDGRLSLARDEAAPFDVLVLDAFSGDAIPVHLLTREAVSVYLHHLRDNGALAFHVSNDFLDLAPAVHNLADDVGYGSVLVHNHADPDEAILPSDWVLVTKNQAVLNNPSIQTHRKPIKNAPRSRVWTDDYSNLLETFKISESRDN